MQGNRTQPSSLLQIATTQQQGSFLPSLNLNYDRGNFASAISTPSLFRSFQQEPQNLMQPSLGPLSAQHRLQLRQQQLEQQQQSFAAQRQYADNALRRASAPSLFPDQMIMGNLNAQLPSETLVGGPSASFNFQQPSSPFVASPPVYKTRKPITLFLQCDRDSLTPYQCLARQQIELFEASPADADAGTQGRNRTITVGQVGIRCKHCAHLPLRERSRGSTYYPSKLTGIYQAAQNMTNSHMTTYCSSVPKEVREELKRLGNKKSSAGGGKNYWSGGAKILGVIEDDHGLRFED